MQSGQDRAGVLRIHMKERGKGCPHDSLRFMAMNAPSVVTATAATAAMDPPCNEREISRLFRAERSPNFPRALCTPGTNEYRLLGASGSFGSPGICCALYPVLPR